MQKRLLFYFVGFLLSLLIPRAAFASPPLILDFISAEGTLTTDNITDAEAWGFSWRPLADTGLCELEIPLQRYTDGGTTAGNVSLAVLASPSTTFYYNIAADSTLDWSLLGSSFANKVFTFYDDVHASDGACPVMYGGHDYRFVFTWNRGNGTGQVGRHAWTDDFSVYTQQCNGTNCLTAQGGEPEVLARGYGAMVYPNIPGSEFYENADPLQWVTSSSYGFTDADFGALGNMVRDLLVWLFYPTQQVETQWNSMRVSFLSKAPISYYVEIKDLLEAQSVASGSFPSISIPFPTVLGSASVDIFSEDTITAFAPSGFLSALRALASASLWLAFVWFVYRELDTMHHT